MLEYKRNVGMVKPVITKGKLMSSTSHDRRLRQAKEGLRTVLTVHPSYNKMMFGVISRRNPNEDAIVLWWLSDEPFPEEMPTEHDGFPVHVFYGNEKTT